MIYHTDTYSLNPGPSLKVHLLPCLKDNYTFVVEYAPNHTFLVDCADFKKTQIFLEQQNLRLTHIFLTHHHYDHVDGVSSLQKIWNCPIYASAIDANRPPLKQIQITSFPQKLDLGPHTLNFVKAPGHTLSHSLIHLPHLNVLFCGDTLFGLGCGRIFEPSSNIYELFFKSLQWIKSLPASNQIYCAHEYTHNNLQFLKSFSPQEALSAEQALAKHKSHLGGSRSVPLNLNFELKHNPFLKARTPKELETLRTNKDHF